MDKYDLNWVGEYTVDEVNRERIAGNRIGCLIACLVILTVVLAFVTVLYCVTGGN